jgi:hypothetical protein
MSKQVETFFVNKKQNEILRKILEFMIMIETNKSGKVTLSAQEKATVWNIQLNLNKDCTL